VSLGGGALQCCSSSTCSNRCAPIARRAGRERGAVDNERRESPARGRPRESASVHRGPRSFPHYRPTFGEEAEPDSVGRAPNVRDTSRWSSRPALPCSSPSTLACRRCPGHGPGRTHDTGGGTRASTGARSRSGGAALRELGRLAEADRAEPLESIDGLHDPEERPGEDPREDFLPLHFDEVVAERDGP
jgi:hypothetical protein